MNSKTAFSREEVIRDLEQAIALSSGDELATLHRQFYDDMNAEHADGVFYLNLDGIDDETETD